MGLGKELAKYVERDFQKTIGDFIQEGAVSYDGEEVAEIQYDMKAVYVIRTSSGKYYEKEDIDYSKIRIKEELKVDDKKQRFGN